MSRRDYDGSSSLDFATSSLVVRPKEMPFRENVGHEVLLFSERMPKNEVCFLRLLRPDSGHNVVRSR
jgi:hypothetical protein